MTNDPHSSSTTEFYTVLGAAAMYVLGNAILVFASAASLLGPTRPASFAWLAELSVLFGIVTLLATIWHGRPLAGFLATGCFFGAGLLDLWAAWASAMI